MDAVAASVSLAARSPESSRLRAEGCSVPLVTMHSHTYCVTSGSGFRFGAFATTVRATMNSHSDGIGIR